ncbi:MAG: prepilin-type N-terminal cleavage/methylation domain-containing protein [Eubacteriales bacterium]|nr:prepilin-type N-terminal cleavage/methylation domain-containing protein [Eubacteriales bacterium]
MKKCRGFTLIELIMAIAIGAMVVAVAFSLIYGGLAAYQKSSQITRGLDTVRLATLNITKDVRAQNQASVSGGATPTLHIGSDISYWLDGTNLMRRSGTATVVAVSGVSSFSADIDTAGSGARTLVLRLSSTQERKLVTTRITLRE